MQKRGLRKQILSVYGPHKLKKIWVIISAILAMVFWGITFVAFKFANESFEPIAIVFIRLIISIPFLFGFALISRRMMKIQRKDYMLFFLLGVFEPFIYFLGEAFGLSLVSSTVGAIIISTIPLFVPIAAYLLLKERLSLTNIIGLAVSFVGVVLVVMATEGQLSGNIKGILLMFLAVFAAVGYTILAKKLVHNYNGVIITAWQSTIGAVLFLPLFLIFEVKRIDFSSMLPESFWALMYLGIFGSGVCFILFTTAIRELGATKANVYANLVPVVTAIVSFYLLKESMPMMKIAGIVIVLAGLLLTQLTAKNLENGTRKWKNWFSIPKV
jgi:drug/metabolite transporter (DMT)-like permease